MPKSSYTRLPAILKNAILERLLSIRTTHPSLQAAAFLDLDGTLIEGDITEGKRNGKRPYVGLLDLAILGAYIEGYSGVDGLKAFWKKYKEDFHKPEDADLWTATLIAKVRSPEDRNWKEFVKHHLSELVSQYLFEFTRDLFAFFSEHNIAPYVISASSHDFVQELHHCLPIPEENLFGLNGRIHNGELVDKIVHDGTGKEQRLKDLCSQRKLFPLFAMGNKWRWDGMMIRQACEQGGVGLLVNEGAPSNYTHRSLFYFPIA